MENYRRIQNSEKFLSLLSRFVSGSPMLEESPLLMPTVIIYVATVLMIRIPGSPNKMSGLPKFNLTSLLFVRTLSWQFVCITMKSIQGMSYVVYKLA